MSAPPAPGPGVLAHPQLGPWDLAALTLPWLLNAVVLLGFVEPMLAWDDWDLADWWLRARDQRSLLRALWERHNEHRPLISRLLFYVIAENRLSLRTLPLLSLLATGATFALLTPLCLAAGARCGRGRPLCLLAFSSFAASWVAWENLLVGMQVAWTCCVLGAVAVVRGIAGPRRVRSYLLAAGGLLLAFLSTAHWVILPPLLAAVLLARWWMRRRSPGSWRGLVGPALLVGATCVMVWLYTLPPGTAVPTSRIVEPARATAFLQLFSGNPFGLGSDRLALPLGMGMLFLLGTTAIGVLALRSRLWSGFPSLAALSLGTLGLSLGAALLTLLGRGQYGSEFALSSRYSAWMLIGWLALLCTVLYHPRGSRAFSIGAKLAVAATLALGLLVSAAKLYRVLTWQAPRRAAAAACLQEVLADERLLARHAACLRGLHPRPRRLLDIARRLPDALLPRRPATGAR